MNFSPSRRSFVFGASAATALAAAGPILPAHATEGENPYEATLTRRREFITGGKVAATHPGLADKRTAIDDEVAELLAEFNTTPGRTWLWPDLEVGTASNTEEVANLGVTADRITALATAWASGGSRFHQDPDVLTKVQGALAFLSEQFRPDRSRPGNWWFWEIGIPRQVADSLTLLGKDGPKPEIVDILIAACRFHSPDPNVRRDAPSMAETGANRVDKSLSCIVRGLLSQNEDDVMLGRDALSDVRGNGANSLFSRVTSGDGFYADGSYIQHDRVPYSGTYGEVAIKGVGQVLAMLADSPWEVTDPGVANLLESIEITFAPFQWDIRAMDTTRGRAVSRQTAQDYDSGFAVASAILVLAEAAPEQDAARYRALVKGWLERTEDKDVATNRQDLAPAARSLAVQEDDAITAAPAPVGTTNTFNQERIVHHTGQWAAVVNTSSERIGRYEWGNNENNTGWYQGDGLMFLYHRNDPGQYSENFWPTVDPYALPGITANGQQRESGKGSGTGIPPAENAYAGGLTLGGVMGTTAMDLHNLTDTMTANKSWFFLEHAIVCLGSAITDTSGTGVRTIVENRGFAPGELPQVLVDGEARVPSEKPVPATSVQVDGHAGYCSLAVPGAERQELSVRSETRTGTWWAINSGGDTAGSKEEFTRDYVRIEQSHPDDGGWYAYQVLPLADAATTTAEAAAPSVRVLAAEDTAHLIEAGFGTRMGHFFDAGSAAEYTVTGPCALGHRRRLVDSDGSRPMAETEVVVSQPTKAGGEVTVTFPFDAPGEVTSGADSVTVASAAPLSLTVSFDGAPGSEHRIRFTGPAPAAPVTVEYVDADGTPLVEPEVITGEIGDQYNARVRRIPGYHPTRMPADKTGRIGAEPITVTLVYASAGHGSG